MFERNRETEDDVESVEVCAMRATGYVRPVDELGRIVLPIALRRDLGIVPMDDIEIYVDGEDIVLQKHRPACVFCDNTAELAIFRGRLVCPACRTAISEVFGSAAD